MKVKKILVSIFTAIALVTSIFVVTVSAVNPKAFAQIQMQLNSRAGDRVINANPNSYVVYDQEDGVGYFTGDVNSTTLGATSLYLTKYKLAYIQHIYTDNSRKSDTRSGVATKYTVSVSNSDRKTILQRSNIATMYGDTTGVIVRNTYTYIIKES